jgi:hypothetical protein
MVHAACGSTGSTGAVDTTDAGADAAQDAKDPDHLDTSAFTQVCGKGVTDLVPSPDVDFLEIRTFEPETPRFDAGLLPDAGDAGADALPWATISVSRRGTPCATATDRAACLTKLTSTEIESSDWTSRDGFTGGAFPRLAYDYYAFTRGETVGTITTRAALLAFVGTIDSPSKAIHVAAGPRGASGCYSMRTDPDGYAFFGTTCNSMDTYVEVVTKIGRDGRATEIARGGPFKDTKGNCLPRP